MGTGKRPLKINIPFITFWPLPPTPPDQQGVAPEAILGIDVSPRMLEHARNRFPRVIFAEEDFLDLEFLERHGRGSFDAVVLNACFANIGHDPRAIVEQACELCRSSGSSREEPGGVVVVSHPHGSAFCRGLSDAAPIRLPNRNEWGRLLCGLPLVLEVFEDGTPYVWEVGQPRGKYLAVLRAV